MEKSYEDQWPELALVWGLGQIAGWHQELETNPPPSAARQIELNKNIEYLGRLLDRFRNDGKHHA